MLLKILCDVEDDLHFENFVAAVLRHCMYFNLLRRGGYTMLSVCFFVCYCVVDITVQVADIYYYYYYYRTSVIYVA